MSDWHWVLGVDLWGVIHGVHTFLPIMLQQGTPGHIVNTASIAGLVSGVAHSPYAVSKVGVVSCRRHCVWSWRLPVRRSV
jgi:NADP-dependent 3-hydroxy acid dehydrogenase YdfG